MRFGFVPMALALIWSSTSFPIEIEILHSEAFHVDTMRHHGYDPLSWISTRTVRPPAEEEFVLHLIQYRETFEGTSDKFHIQLENEHGVAVFGDNVSHPARRLFEFADRAGPTPPDNKTVITQTRLFTYRIPKGTTPKSIVVVSSRESGFAFLKRFPIGTVHRDGYSALQRYIPKFEIVEAEAHTTLTGYDSHPHIDSVEHTIPNGTLIRTQLKLTPDYDLLTPGSAYLFLSDLHIRFSDDRVGMPLGYAQGLSVDVTNGSRSENLLWNPRPENVQSEFLKAPFFGVLARDIPKDFTLYYLDFPVASAVLKITNQ